MPTSRWALAPLFAAAFLLASCSSSAPPPPDGLDAPGPRIAAVSSVEVTVSPSLSDERRQRLSAAEGVSRLQRALEVELSRANRLDAASPYRLEVTVTTYRMRSGATVFWVGAMAGGDSIGVDATVYEGDAVVRRYKTGTGSIGAYAGLDQVSRLERIVSKTAERVVHDL